MNGVSPVLQGWGDPPTSRLLMHEAQVQLGHMDPVQPGETRVCSRDQTSSCPGSQSSEGNWFQQNIQYENSTTESRHIFQL